MKKILLGVLTLIFSLCISLRAENGYLCDQVANYIMDVELDTEHHLILGEEFLTWTNISNTTVEELWFHLYWNAFQNNKSTYFQESEYARQRTSGFLKDDWGYCLVESFEIVQSPEYKEQDLTSAIVYRYPDDSNIHDQTVFSVRLPHPLEPGQLIRLYIRFRSKIPRPVSRTGVYKDNYFIAQWFPKIGVIQNGTWNCYQYHSNSEFFADYGTYDVKLTLPEGYVVGATGELLDKSENSDGSITYHFFQHSVHDFAWTASPRLLEYKKDFEFSHGRTTEITLLLQPEHKRLKERYLKAVENAINYCSLWYGEYPYTTVTCVDPAYNSLSGGMEYPTFFTGGAYFLDKEGTARPEGVTIHEFGHGYFYGLVGSNEFEHPWMDEGFTSFLDTEVYYAAYPRPFFFRRYFGIPVVFKGVEIPIESSGISSHRLTSDMDEMQRTSWKFLLGDSYSANSYAKAELMLRTLERFMGEENFARMIKDYSQRWWFKHPKPEDFIQIVNEHAGRDMGWFLNQVIYGSGKLDYAVSSVNITEQELFKGYLSGEYQEAQKIQEDTELFTSEVIIRRLGDVKLPVDILVRFDDGAEVREQWDGQYRWIKLKYSGPKKVAAVIVDPDFKMVLDINRTNNTLTRSPNKLAAYKWVSTWLIWFQHALELFTLFGG